MEGRERSAWLCAGALLALQCLALAQGLSCNGTQYQLRERCCSRCPPGQKVKANCSEESDTTCASCEEHHFQGGWTKEHHCTPHRSCDKKVGLTVYVNGDKERDAICRCQEETHCSSHECHTCRPNSPCGPGEGVLQEASHERDTLCTPCPSGFYSNVSSFRDQCQPWSSCKEKGLLWKANGTQTTDVICDFLPLVNLKARKTHLLALLPLAALLLGGLLFLWHRHRKCVRKRHQNPPQEPPEPTENEEDCPAFPTQETLLGEQRGIQEKGKDCHLAQQEQV